MIICVVVYFLAFMLVLILRKLCRLKIEKFPPLKLEEGGIVFHSNKRHRIKLYKAKFMQVSKSVYIRKGNKVVQLLNVDNVFIENDYLYFKALGKTKLVFGCEEVSKYLNLKIRSDKIDIEKFRKLALIDIKNHIFDYKNAKFLKIYLKIVRKILNISLQNDKLTIKQNKFKIPFCVDYVSNGVKKRIKINC